MSDESLTGGSASDAVCPWCSAPLSVVDAETCPSCGANLHGEGDRPLPGLTAIDPLAIIEGTRPPQRPRNRIVAWLTGSDIDEEAQPLASPGALAPPSPEVQREMLRLQMEAELSQLSAEAEAMASDEAVAAHEAGDADAARAAVAAVLGADAATEAVNEAAAGASEVDAAAADEAGDDAPSGDDPGDEGQT